MSSEVGLGSQPENINEDFPPQDMPQFTLRSVIVGVFIGTLLCFTNMYFGLQTGWISMMSLQSSLLGFAFFRASKRYLKTPFGPAENVVLQSIAVATGTMPLAAGFVGIIPALQMMTAQDNPGNEQFPPGPIHLSTGQLILWSLGVAFFGVFIAVPLRKQVIVKEKLPFPSGTATAQMIGVLHNTSLVDRGAPPKVDAALTTLSSQSGGLRRRKPVGELDRLDDEEASIDKQYKESIVGAVEIKGEHGEPGFVLDQNITREENWRLNMIALGVSFFLSCLYTILQYFFPVVSCVPIFDWLTGMSVTVAATWQWFFTPSLSYIGQGIIMGFPTTASMLLGCVIGWGVLAPVATHKGWVTGPVSSSTTGGRGWILWVSLGIMIAEAIVSLLGVVVLSLIAHYRRKTRVRRHAERRAALEAAGASTDELSILEDEVQDDAPIDQLVPLKVWVCGLILSSLFALLLIWIVFREDDMPAYATLVAVILGWILSVLGVRALGTTDLNPVSGIGKISQFIFAGVVPGNIIANILAGGVAEAGAQQAGDLMQDLKTGHLLGASPKAQFYGQMIGSVASVFISTGVYKLYNHVYELPGPQFAVPTAKVWLDLARLVNGKPLPTHTPEFIGVFAGLFALLTLIQVLYSDAAFLRKGANGTVRDKPRWLRFLPSGIAFAIGMYNLPNFTLARFIGGVVSLWWDWHCKKNPSSKFGRLGRVFLIIIASGFVLGEGTFSIVNLILKTSGVRSASCVGCYQGACTCN
ncbi:hypothetical protein BGZ76_008697 [Entomortierella beljakovae]|nr:hypothetical protein BGZ76_008697 [Entomortierella beljakovae]